MRVCDKCRKPFTTVFKINVEAYSKIGEHIRNSSRELELCESCYEKISNLLDVHDIETTWVESTVFGKTYFEEKMMVEGSQLIPSSLVINCKKIMLEDRKLDIQIDVTDAMKNCNTVVINDNMFLRPTNTKTWRIIGYVGRSDYDGPSDDNLDFKLELDASVTKDEVLEILETRYKKYRTRVFKLYTED